jgi:hypothetical protein
MTHRMSPCHAKIAVRVAPTQTKAVVRVSLDPVFESVTTDEEPIEDGAHETRAIWSSTSAPWFMVGESSALTLELTQTAIRRVREE